MKPSWHLLTRSRRVVPSIVIGLVIVGLILVSLRVNWYEWTGFRDAATVQTSTERTDAKTGIKTTTTILPPHYKTLWDWQGLLGVPAVLASIGLFFNARQNHAAADLTEDSLLREYFDRLSDLLLKEHLRTSQPADEVRSVARSRTLATLRRLNGERKASLLRFLHESTLITQDNIFIDLRGADLHYADLYFTSLEGANLEGANFGEANLQFAGFSQANLSQANLSQADLRRAFLDEANLQFADLHGANLSQANLHGANLQFAGFSQANLSQANLSQANLHGANLHGANLHEADLHEADLSQANLQGATMPDGSKHP